MGAMASTGDVPYVRVERQDSRSGQLFMASLVRSAIVAVRVIR
jgi:hypothetical protein